MLKRALLSSGLALVVSATTFAASAPVMSNASNFAGFYLGGSIGVSNQYFDVDGKTSSGTKIFSGKTGSYGAAFQLLGGYNYAFTNNWLIGADIHGQYDTNTDSRHDDHETNTAHGQSKMPWQYGIEAKVGFAPFARNLFYAVAGPEWGVYDHKFIHNGVTIFDKNSTLLGGLVGLGAEQALTNNIMLAEQVNYTLYRTASDTGLNGDKVYAKPRVVTALLSLQYRFA